MATSSTQNKVLGNLELLNDIKLDYESKKPLKEGIMLDSSFNTVSNVDKVAGSIEKVVVSRKVIERERFSKYIFPPLMALSEVC